MNDKPKCYDCKWRGDLVGDAHSKCDHPDAIVEKTTGAGLNIKGNEHGIANGWFAWPWNFDPTWLENCDGFTPKIEAQL